MEVCDCPKLDELFSPTMWTAEENALKPVAPIMILRLAPKYLSISNNWYHKFVSQHVPSILNILRRLLHTQTLCTPDFRDTVTTTCFTHTWNNDNHWMAPRNSLDHNDFDSATLLSNVFNFECSKTRDCFYQHCTPKFLTYSMYHRILKISLLVFTWKLIWIIFTRRKSRLRNFHGNMDIKDSITQRLTTEDNQRPTGTEYPATWPQGISCSSTWEDGLSHRGSRGLTPENPTQVTDNV